jgi:hypothetical protein
MVYSVLPHYSRECGVQVEVIDRMDIPTEIIPTFDLLALDAEARIVVQQEDKEFDRNMDDAGRGFVRACRNLQRIHEALRYKRPGFVDYIATKPGLSQGTAYRMLDVAKKFPNLGNIDAAPSALYLLAAPSTPDEARQEVLERASAGEAISHQAAQQIVATHKPPPDLNLAGETLERLRALLYDGDTDEATPIIAKLPTVALRRDWGRDADLVDETYRCAERLDHDGAHRAAQRVVDASLRVQLLTRFPEPPTPAPEADVVPAPPALPKLPDGWRWRPRGDDQLQAQAEDGQGLTACYAADQVQACVAEAYRLAARRPPMDFEYAQGQAKSIGAELTMEPTGYRLVEPDQTVSGYPLTAWDQCRRRIGYLVGKPLAGDEPPDPAAAIRSAIIAGPYRWNEAVQLIAALDEDEARRWQHDLSAVRRADKAMQQRGGREAWAALEQVRDHEARRTLQNLIYKGAAEQLGVTWPPVAEPLPSAQPAAAPLWATAEDDDGREVVQVEASGLPPVAAEAIAAVAASLRLLVLGHAHAVDTQALDQLMAEVQASELTGAKASTLLTVLEAVAQDADALAEQQARAA